MENRGRILVVDDEPTIVFVMSEFVKACGFEVITASSGNQAMQMIKEVGADCVISDICMPDGDGLSLLQWIREYDSKISVILFSGYDPSHIREKVRFEVEMLNKPVSFSDIKNILTCKWLRTIEDHCKARE
jgi:YesN/AraC family two-component response regulator